MKKTVIIITVLFCLMIFSSCTELKSDTLKNQSSQTKTISPENSLKSTPPQNEPRETVETDASALLPFINAEGKYGYMDNQGNVIIKPVFDSAMRFMEDIAVVWKDKKAGYIDSTGNTIIPMEYDNAFPASGGIVTTVINKPEGDTTIYLDTNGNELLRVDYYTANPFYEGLAAVRETESSNCRFIDITGKFLIDTQFYNVGDFHEGKARFSRTGENGMGYIDKSGKVVLEGFYYASDFSEGLAAVRKDGKWGYINKDGEVVLSFDILKGSDRLFDFYEGMALISVNNLLGVIDRNGEYVIEPQYKGAGGVFEGLIMLYDDYGKDGMHFYYETLDGKKVEPKE